MCHKSFDIGFREARQGIVGFPLPNKLGPTDELVFAGSGFEVGSLGGFAARFPTFCHVVKDLLASLRLGDDDFLGDTADAVGGPADLRRQTELGT